MIYRCILDQGEQDEIGVWSVVALFQYKLELRDNQSGVVFPSPGSLLKNWLPKDKNRVPKQLRRNLEFVDAYILATISGRWRATNPSVASKSFLVEVFVNASKRIIIEGVDD